MPGTHRTCEICGIKERSCSEKLFFARFPLDQRRCVEWLKVVGKEDLAYLSIEKLHDLRHVCGNHFTKRDFTKSGTRLKKHAVPKLQIPAVTPLTEHVITEFLRLNSHEGDASTTSSCTSTRNNKPSTQSVTQDLEATASTSTLQATPSPKPLDTAVQQIKKRPLSIHDCKVFDPAMPSTSRATSENEPKRLKTTKADLNPSELELVEKLRKAKATIKSLKKSAKLIESIKSSTLKEIIMMTLKNQKRKPRGRRWTTKYKISLLAIFKRSPKTYKYLKYLVPLPSINTITAILNKIPIEPGICHKVIAYLKKQCPKNVQERACCLLFDEMAIKPRLLYNNASDKIEGYTDLGNGERNCQIADHALVFMLQGLKKKFKQPIAFYFVKGTISSSKLAALIRTIITSISDTGYNIIATICDQGPTNMGAIKILKETSSPLQENCNNNTFTVNEMPVFIVYDVPHLFKSIRNNFLNYGSMMMDGKTAKWEHLMKVEERNRNLLYLSKVSLIHVQPKYRAKMKVKYAAQILSNTVAAVLKLLSLAEQDLTQSREIMDTANIIQELDKLFDFTNGPSGPQDIKKGQRQNVSSKTDHVKVWSELRKKMETVKFFKLTTGAKATNVRCIQGYLVTLCSLRDIWAKCLGLGFKYLNLRQLNQDSLENLFGVIRQHSPTNKNPTAASFIAAIKTAVVSKLTAPHSRGANCQRDSNQLLTDFHDIVFTEENDVMEKAKENKSSGVPKRDDSDCQSYPVLNISDFKDEEEEECQVFLNLDKQPVAYLSGYIAHRILKKHKCFTCKKTLVTDPEEASNKLFSYIKLREWCNENSLTYPSNNLFKLVESCVIAFERELLEIMHISNIRLTAITLFLANSTDLLSTLGCSEHQKIVTDLIMTDLALLLIRRQCDRVNKNISLDEEKLADIVKKNQQRGYDK